MNRHAVVMISLSMWSAQAAYAADTNHGEQEDGAQGVSARADRALQITPYLWAAGLKGNLSPFRRAPTLRVEKSFSDVVEDLNFGGFVNLWGRRGRFVFSGDVMYVDTTGSEATGPLPALQIPGIGVIPPGADVEAKVDTKQFMATVQGGYRVVDNREFTLDVLAGLRFWRISNDVEVTVRVPVVGTRSARYGERFDWVDPVLGARAFMPLWERSSLQAQVDFGGFGAGSDRTWSVLATFNHVFSDRFSASVGYKVLDVDYDHDGYVYDTRQSGPVLGITWRY